MVVQSRDPWKDTRACGERRTEVPEGCGLSVGDFLGKVTLGSQQTLGTASPSPLGCLVFLSQHFGFSLCICSVFLSSQLVLLTHHFYSPVISTNCAHASPALSLHKLSVVQPATTNGSFPLKVFAQIPGGIWSFFTLQTTDPTPPYGSVSLRWHTHPVICRCKSGGGGLQQ